MTCPVKSIQPWKDLVAIHGDAVSHYLWDKYDGEVPESYYTKDITTPIKETSTAKLVSKAVQLKNAIEKDLPKKIANIVTIVDSVPDSILGRRDMFFAMKDVFATIGITDPLLVNWAGVNKALFGNDPKNIKSQEQLEKLIEDIYEKKKDANNYPEFQINKIASASFKDWKKALKAYPLVFRDIMLTHAIKHITDVNRESKYVLELSNVALSNTYEILKSKPHEANRLGKLYNEEVLKTVSDAIGHEPSASGRGYWVHVPKTKNKNFGYKTYEQFVSSIENLIKSREESIIFDNEKSSPDYYNGLVKKLSELKSKTPIFTTQEPSLNIEDINKYGFKEYSFVRIESVVGRGGNNFKKELGENYSGYYIHGYNTRIGASATRILAITKEEAEAIWRDSLKTDKYQSFDVSERQDVYRLENEVATYSPEKIYERTKRAEDDINKYKNDLKNTTKDNWDSNVNQYKTNVELLRKLSPSTWCTSSGMAGHYVENYDNYILIVNGITVAGIEASTDIDSNGKRLVHEVTSRANNGVASIDHLDDTLAFFEKHNLDKTNRTIVNAINSKKKGHTDQNAYSREENVDEDGHDENWWIDEFNGEHEYDPPEYNQEQEEAWQELEHERYLVSQINSAEQALREIETGGLDVLSNFNVLPQEITNNEELSRKAVEFDPHNALYLNENLPIRRELITSAVVARPGIFEYLSDEDKTIGGLREIYDDFMVGNPYGIPDDLPFSKTNNNLIQGYYDANNDKVVVVAANTPTNEASQVAIHEVAHRGMLRMAKELGGLEELGKPLFAAEKQLMRKLPELLKRTGHASLESLMMDYGFTTDSKEGKVKLLMELSARWAESLVNKPKPSWWSQLIKNIGKWITKFTGKTLSETEVNKLVGGFVQYGTRPASETKTNTVDLSKKDEGIKVDLKPTEPSKQKIEELNKKLVDILSSLGVTVEQFEDFKKEYGVDAIGVMEILDGVAKIRWNENLADELTLPEETAHFFIELFGQSEIGKRLVQAMKTNDYFKTVLGEEFERYNELYKGDIEKLSKEAAGKLLANALVSNFKNEELQAPAVQYGLLTRFWNYIKNIFRNVNQITTEKMISDLYGEVAENILTKDFSHLRLQNIKGGQRYFQISDLSLNRLKTALDNTVLNTAKRIQVLKAKNKTGEAYKDQAYLEKLVDSVNNSSYVRSALSYSEFARDKFKRVSDAVIALRLKLTNLDHVTLLEAASTLKDMHNFGKSYTNTINELKLEVDRILLEEPDNKDYQKVSQILGDIKAKIDLLEGEYLELARPIFAKYLEPFVGAGFLHVNLEDELKFMNKDITFAQRWIDSMAEASSPILQLIDVAVKEAKRTAYESAFNDSKNLLHAQDILHKAGFHDESFVYERLKNGDLSGNFVTDYNWGQWEYDRKDFFTNLLKELNLPIDTDKRNEILEANPELKKVYGKKWATWFKKFSQTIPNVNAVIQEHKKAMTSEEYEVWDRTNISRDEMTGEILSFKGELTMPSDVYRSKEFQDISNNKAKLDFYNTVMDVKKNLDSLLPDQFRTERLAPQLRKDFIERLKSAAKGEHVGLIKRELEDQFTITEDDTRFGARIKMFDESKNLVNFLPIHFTKKLKVTNDMSTDVISSMSSYSLMANEYSQMSKVIDMLEMGRDIINAREILETDSKGNPIMESLDVLGKKVLRKVFKSKADTNNTIDRLNDYYNMVVYGKMKKEGTSIDVFGTKLNDVAMLELLGKYTAISNLGLNLYAGIQNPIVGNTNIRLEGIAGQFVNNKDLLKADTLYWKLLPGRVAQFGKHNVTNKMDLWFQYFDVMQEFGSELRNMDTSRKSLFSKLFKTSSLFVFSSSGEHYMQMKMSLALAYATKLKDKSGKDITLVDAYEVVGNKLQLKEGITKLDGTAWTVEDTRKFIRQQNFINKRLHGIYNDVDKGAMQQYAAFRLVMMFRKFMRPGYNRRWRKADYSFEGQIDTEGYYRTFGRFMGTLLKDIRRGEFLIKAHWNEMAPNERANIMRTMGEIGFAFALMGAFMALNGLGDDDKDNWLLNMFAYQVNRYQSELLFFIDPRQTMTLLKSPAAAVDQANRLLDLMFLVTKPGYAMEEITRGKWEGYTHLGKASVGTIPMFKTIHDWATPQDKLIYFQLNSSNR